MNSPKIIAITSGKGGVGKTSLAINLGIALSQQHKVCLFDADTNLANINIMLRLSPENTLEQVTRGDKSILEVVQRKAGVDIVPGASGITDFINLTTEQQQQLVSAMAQLEQHYDYLLVDTSAGVHESVLGFIENAHQALVVITPEPTSLTDAFSLLRILRKRNYKKAVNVVVNLAKSELHARNVFNRFSGAVAKYIGYRVRYLGFILRDVSMSEAITWQKPLVLYKPASPASQCFSQLAKNIQRLTDNLPEVASLSDILKNQARMPGIPSFSISGRQTKTASINSSTKPGLDDYKILLKTLIEDSSLGKKHLDELLNQLLQDYEKRFDEYPFHPIDALNHYLENNRIPQKRLNELLITLQLFYQGKMSEADGETWKQYLQQWINNYVGQFKSYPFDIIYTLYQYLELETVPAEQLRELLKTLHLIYANKYTSESTDKDNEIDLLYCNELNTEDMKHMINSLQEKLLQNLGRKLTQQPDTLGHDHNRTHFRQEMEDHSILDSIRYASLTDE